MQCVFEGTFNLLDLERDFFGKKICSVHDISLLHNKFGNDKFQKVLN